MFGLQDISKQNQAGFRVGSDTLHKLWFYEMLLIVTPPQPLMEAFSKV